MEVIKDFVCKVTGNLYKAGTEYDGDRIKELQKLGYVNSERDDTISEWPKHIGGGYYELSNSKRVKGKDAAIAVQAEIDASAN